jgi:ribosomal protein S18 acetylase RimI-like enzyme
MYVRPALRGIARQLILAIEEEAMAAGRPVIRLETGRHLPAAIALYQSAGYHEVPAAAGHSVCFEKRLAALVQ